MSNKVLITNSQKAVKVPSGLRILIRRACNAVLEYEHFDRPAEISVTFVDNAAIAELNNQYRNKPMPTDVLSFPLGENGKYDIDENNGCMMLGDIVISMERAMEQANLYGHPLQREVAFLTVHSMLHLLGYDHENGGLEACVCAKKKRLCCCSWVCPARSAIRNDIPEHKNKTGVRFEYYNTRSGALRHLLCIRCCHRTAERGQIQPDEPLGRRESGYRHL